MIASASHYCCCFLFLISAFQTNAYLVSPSRQMETEIEKVSGEADVEALNIGSAMIAKLRMLLGLQALSSASKTRTAHQLSPAPSPAEARAMSPSLPPLLYKHHTFPRAPPPRQGRLPLGTTNHGEKASRKKLMQMVVAISVSVAAILAFAATMAVLLLAHRRRRQQRNILPCNSSNKVSFDPAPADLFYLNSLAPFLETDSIFKQSSGSKSVAWAESTRSCPLQNSVLSLEQSNLDMEDISEFLSHDKTSSDDNESFHSVCSSPANSHVSPQDSSKNSVEFSIQNGTTMPIPSSHQSASKDTDESSNPISKLSSESSDQMIRESSSNLMPPAAKVMKKPESVPGPPQIMTKPKPPQPPLPPPQATNKPKQPPPPPPPPPAVVMHKPKQPPPNKTKQPPLPPPPLPAVVMHKPQQPPPVVAATAAPVPTPPPPPCLMPKNPRLAKDGNPLPKLKPLHWDKVRAAPDRSMVWDRIRSSSFELDEKMIESLFGYRKDLLTKNEEPKGKSSSPSKHVLEHKRLQNFTILLKAINATAEQVCNALRLGRGLGAQQLEALAKMVPTKEEEDKILNYNGDIDDLGHTERFLKVILSVPFAFSRIETMLYRETFEDEVIHLKKSFAMLEEACKELRSSRLFLRLLEAVLKTGNRMNDGTIRGGARAFKLDALLKLADVKAADGKTTLLHFVVQEMIRSEGPNPFEKKKKKKETRKDSEEDYAARGLVLVSELSGELCNVKKTASMDLEVLAGSVSNLAGGMRKLKELVEVELQGDEMDESFANSIRVFEEKGEGTIRDLEENEERVLRHVREITEYYHGDVSKEEANPLRIFVIVSDFLGMLDRVCKELTSSKNHQKFNLAPFPMGS